MIQLFKGTLWIEDHQWIGAKLNYNKTDMKIIYRTNAQIWKVY
jgi:hypothetical protein